MGVQTLVGSGGGSAAARVVDTSVRAKMIFILFVLEGWCGEMFDGMVLELGYLSGVVGLYMYMYLKMGLQEREMRSSSTSYIPAAGMKHTAASLPS